MGFIDLIDLDYNRPVDLWQGYQSTIGGIDEEELKRPRNPIGFVWAESVKHNESPEQLQAQTDSVSRYIYV